MCDVFVDKEILIDEKKNFTYTFSEHIFSVCLYSEILSGHIIVCQFTNTIHSTFSIKKMLHYIPFKAKSLTLYLRFSSNDLTSNGCLHSDLKHLPRYGVFESLAHGFPWAVRTVSVMKTHQSKPLYKLYKKIHQLSPLNENAIKISQVKKKEKVLC